MAKCNTKLFYGYCPSVTPVDPEEDKKPEDSKKEEQKPEVKPLPTPVPPKPCCHTFKVENITVVGEEVFVILDDCTFLKAPKSVLDKSVSECKDNEAKATLEALQKALDELKPKVEALEAKEDKDTVYDPSVLEARVTALENAPVGDKVDTTKFVRKDELVDVQNWAGTVRFKAYPADVNTVESPPQTVNPDDRL